MPDITQPASGRGQNSRSPLMALPRDLATRLLHSYPEKAQVTPGRDKKTHLRETTREGLRRWEKSGLVGPLPSFPPLGFPTLCIFFIWREDSERYKNTDARTSTLRSHPTHTTHTHPSPPAQRHTHLEVNLRIQGLAPCQL